MPLAHARLPALTHPSRAPRRLIGGALAGHGVPDARVVLPATFWLAGASGVAAQVVLACSLLTYRPPASAAAVPPLPTPPPAPPRREGVALQHAAMMSVLLMVYAPCHLLVAAIATLYLLLTPSAASAVLAVAGTAYARTYMGHPGHTGARTWPRFQAYCQSVLSVALSRWFGTVRIVAAVAHPQHAADAEPSAEHAGAPPIVFGYHPHGMYPAAAAWFHLTPQWRDAFPGVSPVTMGASAIFWTPMLRDVVMWSGARIVSRLAVRRALQSERRPIVLCPGGQAELVEHRAGAVTVLCTRHKGFIKCAIEAGAPVCPIFVFGESQAQRNLLSVKGLQRWTAKRLGFPFPFIPGGYMRVLPLPEPKPLTFVVGPQLPPPPGRTLGAPASDAEVDAVHKLYYAALVVRYARAHGGLPA
jgi:2-acylglycerol O-acyltransferase 2